MNKIKKHHFSTLVVVVTTLSLVWPSNAGIFDCFCCRDVDVETERKITTFASKLQKYHHCELTKEEALAITPPYTHQEINNRAEEGGDLFHVYHIRTVADLGLMRIYANFRCCQYCVFIVGKSDEILDFNGTPWIPPFGNTNPLQCCVILLGRIFHVRLEGDLESGFFGAVDAFGCVFDVLNRVETRPGPMTRAANIAFQSITGAVDKMAPVIATAAAFV